MQCRPASHGSDDVGGNYSEGQGHFVSSLIGGISGVTMFLDRGY